MTGVHESLSKAIETWILGLKSMTAVHGRTSELEAATDEGAHSPDKENLQYSTVLYSTLRAIQWVYTHLPE